MTITAEELDDFAAGLAEVGLTPLDLADALHRQKLADPDFDPVEEGRDFIRAAISKLMDAIAYLKGHQRQAIFDNMVKVTDASLTGDARLLDMLDTAASWTATFLQEATGTEVAD